MEYTYPIRATALQIDQPLGSFYVIKLSAKLLLDLTYSNPLRVDAQKNRNLFNPFKGTQRAESQAREREIGRYIDTVEAAFPNSLILGANYDEDDIPVKEVDKRWRVEKKVGSDCLELIIPTSKPIATLIDGQHRLRGFRYATAERQNVEMLCAVYLDLPSQYQAYIFATINFNQKKVDKSLAYELFGVDLEEQKPNTWSPDKLAVFLCRKLNIDEASPLHHRIRVAVKNAEELFDEPVLGTKLSVSTASIVDNLLGLFSSDAKRDRDTMHTKSVRDGRSRSVLQMDSSPLRRFYLDDNDLAIYEVVSNYFLAVETILWSSPKYGSFIIRTIGVQALFDILKKMLRRTTDVSQLDKEFFFNMLRPASDIDFSDNFFQASGQGRTRVRNILELKIGLTALGELQKNITEADYGDYVRLGGV